MVRRRYPIAAALAVLTCCATAVAAGPAQASVAGRVAAAPDTAARRAQAIAVTARTAEAPDTAARQYTSTRPGANLMLNPGAQAGAFSVQGWDAVTIPGWQILSGLPTVVRYGTPHFPPTTGRWPALRSGQMFAGGAGGTARLRQVIPLRSAGMAGVPADTQFSLAGWLGGDKHSRAMVSVTFKSAAGRLLGRRTIGPVSGHTVHVITARRAISGVVPAGSASAVVVLTLATSLRNVDGPYAPVAGYDRAVADGLRFSVSVPVQRRVLTAPAPEIPRFQHVFLFYFENEDYGSVIGNTSEAPFLNSLLPQGSLLGNFYAEEHPSDANYLALAGGSAFGIPLTDPLEENSQYTIRARNIGDLINKAHETWKAYLQSANGPCDDTVHGYYWDDDLPMTYFADVRDRPAYCVAHLVPLQSLQSDLVSTASTPNFAWIGPNDCADMEGCGIRSGDNFLATELGLITRSPAWRTQRSLAIITFDEDAYDNQHPAQHVATIILGSAAVRRGYVSHVRYTHYSLLRTIEAALGLGTLTRNDRYAEPVNDVFVHGTAATVPGSGPVGAAVAAPAVAASAPTAPTASAPTVRPWARYARAGRAVPTSPRELSAPLHQTAFVVNSASNTVTPVDLVTRRAGTPIGVGKDPQAIAMAPNGATAYVVNSRSGSVTPISTVARQPGTSIPVGSDPQDIAITPDGRTAYVTDTGSDSVTPIDLLTGQPGKPIPVGTQPQGIAITPNGRTAFVLNWGGSSVTPISIRPGRPGRAGRPIPVGGYPFAISIAPDGTTAYVASYGSDTVTPIDVATRKALRPIPVGQAPDALAVTPDGRTVYAVGGDSDTLTPITVASGTTMPVVPVGFSPAAVAISTSGRNAFVVNTIPGTVTPVSVTSGRAGKPINVGTYNYPTAIEMAPSGPLAVVVGTYAGQVTLVNTTTLRAIGAISVGNYPVAVAIAP